MIKSKFLPLIALLSVATSVFGSQFSLSELDRSYRKFGLSVGTAEQSDLDLSATSISLDWIYGNEGTSFVTAVSLGYTDMEGLDLVSSTTLLGYRIKLSDKLDIVPGIGLSYRNLSVGSIFGQVALADAWTFTYGATVKYALLENTTISAGFLGESGDIDSWASEINGLSIDSVSYGFSVEQYFSDQFSVVLGYGTDAIGTNGFSVGFSFLY